MTKPIQNHQAYYEDTFENLQFEPGEVITGKFVDCIFKGCAFGGVILRDCRFKECTFRECDLSLAEIAGTSFFEVCFIDSRLIGIDWTQGDWSSPGFGLALNFNGCILNHATFIGLELQDTPIIKCVAHEVDFRETNLTRADFRGTDLAKSIFGNTNLSQADLSQARNYAIDPGHNTLKQALFSLPEAMSLLFNMDIILGEDQDESW